MNRFFRKLSVFFVSLVLVSSCAAQQKKPLLIIKVETESDIGTRPGEVSDLSAQEIQVLKRVLTKSLGTIYELTTEADKRDCIELGVVAEKIRLTRGTLYIASSAIAVGKGDADLLLTHNAVIQPSLEKLGSAINYQVSLITLQSLGRAIDKK